MVSLPRRCALPIAFLSASLFLAACGGAGGGAKDHEDDDTLRRDGAALGDGDASEGDGDDNEGPGDSAGAGASGGDGDGNDGTGGGIGDGDDDLGSGGTASGPCPDGNSGIEGGLNCDAAQVVTDDLPPACAYGLVPQVIDGTWGSCVSISKCGCENPGAQAQCGDGLSYVCYQSLRCGDLVH